MWRVALKNLAARKLRLALTLLTIVLGITFITGTFVFTDSLQKQFNELVSVGGPDITVTAASPLEDLPPELAPPQTMDADVVDRITSVPGVASVDPGVTARDAYVLDSSGAAVTLSGAPALGLSWPADPSLSGITVERGRAPKGRKEVALLADTAERADVGIGDTVAVNTPEAGTVHPEVVALVSRRLTGSAGGTLAMFDLPTMQEYFTGRGLVTSVDVMVDPGSTSDEVATALRDELGKDFTVATAEETADELAQTIGDAFSFIDRFLLVFGLIALFVTAFLIFNTFSMLVAQRSRELALLRAVGATRGQVRSSVLLEAAVLGLLASTLGLGFGIAVSQLLRVVVGALGFDLPPGPLVIAGRTILLAYVVGILVTTLSAMLPARRASAVAPVAAMRADAAPTRSSMVRTTVAGLIGVGVSAALAWRAISIADAATGRAAQLTGLSAATGLLAMIAMAPGASRTAIGVLGAPVRGRVVGRIAVENGRRNPRRTAATASALAIGLALMSGIGVIAASAKASIGQAVNDTIGADFLITGAALQTFPSNVATAVKDAYGVAEVGSVKRLPAEIDGKGGFMAGVDPKSFTALMSPKFTAGSLDDLGKDGVAIDSQTAESSDLAIGDRIKVVTADASRKLVIRAIFESAGLLAGVITSQDVLKRLGKHAGTSMLYVQADPEVPIMVVRASLMAELENFPAVVMRDQSELKGEINRVFNQLFGFIYALLALAVLVAFLGIVNTLSLSVFERTREVGLLRAVGTARAQVQRMLFIESLLIAVFGAVTGLAVGLAYGVLLRRVLAGEGLTVLAIPWGQVAAFLAIGAIGGVVAAAWPASRAARLDVLRAIATE